MVVAYRAFNERSGNRFGQVSATVNQENSSGTDNAFSYPHGLSTPAAFVAMVAQRYMYDYGATSEDFGRIAVVDRKHAAVNPKAFFYGKPITLADHQASRSPSPNRCTCWTAARNPMAGWRSWSSRRSGPVNSRSGP